MILAPKTRRIWQIAACLLSTLFLSAACSRGPASPPVTNAVPTPASIASPTPNISPTQTQPVNSDRKEPGSYTNPIGMAFVEIGPGAFDMGAPDGENGRSASDGPVHRVEIGYSFLMGKFEVTQDQYQKVMGINPSKIDDCLGDEPCSVGANIPVENVSWNDAKKFVEKLSAKDPKYQYRLPSESEWEFGCRAGSTTIFSYGDSLGSDQANFDGRSPYGSAAAGVYKKKAVPVGSYQPNKFGLYDMHGNVSEWVEDYFHDDYSSTPTDGKAMETKGRLGGRVSRGGGYLMSGRHQRCASRKGDSAEFSPVSGGFRVVAVAR